MAIGLDVLQGLFGERPDMSPSYLEGLKSMLRGTIAPQSAGAPGIFAGPPKAPTASAMSVGALNLPTITPETGFTRPDFTPAMLPKADISLQDPITGEGYTGLKNPLALAVEDKLDILQQLGLAPEKPKGEAFTGMSPLDAEAAKKKANNNAWLLALAGLASYLMRGKGPGRYDAPAALMRAAQGMLGQGQNVADQARREREQYLGQRGQELGTYEQQRRQLAAQALNDILTKQADAEAEQKALEQAYLQGQQMVINPVTGQPEPTYNRLTSEAERAYTRERDLIADTEAERKFNAEEKRWLTGFLGYDPETGEQGLAAQRFAYQKDKDTAAAAEREIDRQFSRRVALGNMTGTDPVTGKQIFEKEKWLAQMQMQQAQLAETIRGHNITAARRGGSGGRGKSDDGEFGTMTERSAYVLSMMGKNAQALLDDTSMGMAAKRQKLLDMINKAESFGVPRTQAIEYMDTLPMRGNQKTTERYQLNLAYPSFGSGNNPGLLGKALSALKNIGDPNVWWK